MMRQLKLHPHCHYSPNRDRILLDTDELELLEQELRARTEMDAQLCIKKSV